jgi:exopolyphosphatase/guanosine-5'-triphosphate,3'-diphosphate pyrophosphatase
MRVAIIDVGSNTIRMLVAESRDGRLTPVLQRKSPVGLGEDVERFGAISTEKVTRAGKAVRLAAEEARTMGCARLEVVVTSPGRQAGNADRLVRALERGARASARVLSAEEEARLAYIGALACHAEPVPGTVAVCDVGGGSTQIAIGTEEGGVAWYSSLDLGSLRLTVRAIRRDPPRKADIVAAREEARRAFDGMVAPLPMHVLAVGGSARNLAKLVGGRLGKEELALAVRLVRKQPASELARDFRLDPARASTLAAGALILAEVRRRFQVPLDVVPWGLREGAAVSLVCQSSAA